jgi:hypothetical protein
LFEIFTILFVILGIVSSVLQAAQRRKKAGTGFPPPAKTETRRIEITEDNTLSKKAVRKGAYKTVQTQPERDLLIREEVKPVMIPVLAQTKIDADVQHEISIDRQSVLNGVIFSVILSPPKCKGMDSIL